MRGKCECSNQLKPHSKFLIQCSCNVEVKAAEKRRRFNQERMLLLFTARWKLTPGSHRVSWNSVSFFFPTRDWESWYVSAMGENPSLTPLILTNWSKSAAITMPNHKVCRRGQAGVTCVWLKQTADKTCLVSPCSGGQKTSVFLCHKVKSFVFVLQLQHLGFTVIPECVVPLFFDHNGNLRCKADLDNVPYVDGWSNRRSA